MKRILAIDYGKKRIGIAVSDQARSFAQPVCIIPGSNHATVFEKIRVLCAEYEVDKIIVGLPLSMDGSRGIAAFSAERFAQALGAAIPLPVILWDERLTTADAERMLVEEADLSRKKRRKVRDKIAACFILQAYLDSRAHAAEKRS
jgi:putative holliday junction resolvase